MTLPRFGFVSVHESPVDDGPALEAEWLARTAASGRAAAHLWRSVAGFVVPRSYTRLPGWAAAHAAPERVWVRGSGGGLVPQGPGVLNFSLVWRTGAAQPTATDAVYTELCAGLASAFRRLGIATTIQAVDGSFCDGRYNLAVGGAKVVGTAQAWRRVDGQPVVLAHAVIVASADPQALIERANAFESALGGQRRYRAEAVTSAVRAWSAAHGDAVPPVDFDARLVRAIAERFAQIVMPAADRGGSAAPVPPD